MGTVQAFAHCVAKNREEQEYGAFGAGCEQEIAPKLAAIANSEEGLSRQIAKQQDRT